MGWRLPHLSLELAYRERPSDRERREHHDERRAAAALHPRTGLVEPAPRTCPINDDAPTAATARAS
jgi:hypothetical protein